MKIYLVQHGQQVSKKTNPNEPLSDKGRADSEKVAEFALNAGVNVSAVYHSVKLRAKQTAEIFAKHLLTTSEPEEKEGLKPMDDVNIWIDKLEEGLMLVGHLPFMQKLSSLLITRHAENSVIKFKQGGIVCLEKIEGVWSIQFMVTPEIL